MPPRDTLPEAVPAQSYGEFSAALRTKLLAQRIPSSTTIEVTRRCPLACVHCYNNLPMGDQEARAGELTLEEHCRLLDELAAAGTLWLLFTGGEIFARHDFLDIYTYAKKKGFFITLFTNGTLITPRIADYLVEWRPFAIEITLYGATRETYEKLTGAPGSFDRCQRGIKLLLDRKLPLSLKSVAVSVNKHEIGAMKTYAEGLGLRFKFDPMMSPRIDCSQSPIAVRLEPWEVVKMDLEDAKRVEVWTAFAESQKVALGAIDHRQELYHCAAGVIGAAVDPEGKMSFCVLSRQDTYDWRQGGFDEGWSFLKEVRGKVITRTTKCTTCRIKTMCGMCPANGELENNDPEEPVDFLCHVAHLRAATMEIAVPAHGDCDYCQGGAAHPALLDSLHTLNRRMNERWTEDGSSTPKVIPIVSTGCATGGNCPSCGH